MTVQCLAILLVYQTQGEILSTIISSFFYYGFYLYTYKDMHIVLV